MDLPWADERKRKFVTNVGLITTRGIDGDNIMAAEWTHHVSYSPGLIAVCINPKRKSAINIAKNKDFGVNLASVDQNVLASIAGGNTGNDTDKIKVLKELGYKFSEAKKIKTLMVDGSSMQAECKLIKKIKLGSHIMFVGEIVELYPLSDKESLIYYGGKYWKAGEQIHKPAEADLQKIQHIIDKHKKNNKKLF